MRNCASGDSAHVGTAEAKQVDSKLGTIEKFLGALTIIDVHEDNKRVSHVACALKDYEEIQEIKGAPKTVDLVEEQRSGVSIRDVTELHS